LLDFVTGTKDCHGGKFYTKNKHLFLVKELFSFSACGSYSTLLTQIRDYNIIQQDNRLGRLL